MPFFVKIRMGRKPHIPPGATRPVKNSRNGDYYRKDTFLMELVAMGIET